MNTFKDFNVKYEKETPDASTVLEAKSWYKRFTGNKGEATDSEIVELYKMLKKTVDK